MEKRVLLIDDDEVSNFICSRLLERSGFAQEVIVTLNARSALDYLQDCDDVRNWPDVILLDINMPVMDGWDFLAAYKQLDAQARSQTRLFLFSSSCHEEDVARSKTYDDVEEYLFKPLTREIIDHIASNGMQLRSLTA